MPRTPRHLYRNLILTFTLVLEGGLVAAVVSQGGPIFDSWQNAPMYVIMFAVAPTLFAGMAAQALATVGVDGETLHIRNWVRTHRIDLKAIESAAMARTSAFGMTGWLPMVRTVDGREIKIICLGGTPLRGDELGQEWVDWINANSGEHAPAASAKVDTGTNPLVPRTHKSGRRAMRLMGAGSVAFVVGLAADRAFHAGVVGYAVSAGVARLLYVASIRRENQR